MNIQRPKPIRLQKLEAILPRINPTHPKYAEMEKELAQRIRGYIGEKQVDYHLETLSHKAIILPGVNLQNNGRNFEMDHFLATPHAVYIIDTKNFVGTITFDTVYKQLIRDDGEKETGYRYPVTQVQTQKLKLQQWLHRHGLQDVPIHCFIAVSEPSTIIKVKGDDSSIKNIVAHGEYIPHMILEKESQLQHSSQRFIPHKKLTQLIINHNKEPDVDILNRFDIKSQDIRPGVRCPHCDWLGMERIFNNWQCPKCKVTSQYAHKAALRDFFLLIQPWITNKIGRYWLGVSSKSVITRLFKQEKFIYNSNRQIWTQQRRGGSLC